MGIRLFGEAVSGGFGEAALAYNLANLPRTPTLPANVEHWSAATSWPSWQRWRCRMRCSLRDPAPDRPPAVQADAAPGIRVGSDEQRQPDGRGTTMTDRQLLERYGIAGRESRSEVLAQLPGLVEASEACLMRPTGNPSLAPSSVGDPGKSVACFPERCQKRGSLSGKLASVEKRVPRPMSRLHRIRRTVHALRRHPRASRGSIIAFQSECLRDLVRHAYENVPYYGRCSIGTKFTPGRFRASATLRRSPSPRRAT